MGSKIMPMAFIKLVPFNISEATRNGNIDGKTTPSQSSIAFSAEVTAVFEKIIREPIKRIPNKGITSTVPLYLLIPAFFEVID